MIEELSGDFLQWLRGFYYIARTGSIRGAAQMMNRNPSTISYQLRSLEQALNTALFDRQKKSLQITAEGERLLEWTISTFETLRGMLSDVSAEPGSLRGDVTISSNLPFAVQAVGVIADFCEKFPKTRIKIRRALDQGVIEDVESARVDFGLAALTTAPENSRFKELFKSPPLLILRKGHPYKLPPKPQAVDLAALPFVSFLSEQLESTLPPQFSLAKDDDGHAARRSVLSVNNYHLMLRYVMHGTGAAVMDEMCFKSSIYGTEWNELISYPLDGVLPTVQYGILVRRKKYLSPQAHELMQALEKGLRNLAGQE